MLYQIQFKRKTKTFTIDLEFNSYSNALDFFQDLSACRVTEIRQYKYINSYFIKDDGNYLNHASILMKNDFSEMRFKIPKIKKNIESKLFDICQKNFTVKGSAPNFISINFDSSTITQ